MMKHLQQLVLCVSILGVGTLFVSQQQPKEKISSNILQKELPTCQRSCSTVRST